MAELRERFESLSRTRTPDLWPDIEGREPGRPIEPSSARRVLVAMAALVVAAAGVGLAAVTFGGSEPATVLGSSGQVGMANGPIYVRVGGGDGGSHIEAVEPDGSGQRVVFEGEPMRIAQIAWSPDGTKIAYQNPIVDERGIFVANADGSDAVRLTEGWNDGWPSWSPDGSKILFTRSAVDPGDDRCIPGTPHDFRCPTDIHVMDADGSNVVRLTDDPAGEFMPVWSPDGGLIAFAREGDLVAGTYEAIFAMRPDGTNVRQVSSASGGSDFWPNWSPDGTQLVFAAIRREDWGIWTVDADGSNERLILGRTGHVDNPVWSPDGSLIAFVGNLSVDDYSAEDALYVMRPDGTDVTPIADAPGIGVAGDIAWQPIQARAETVGPTLTTATETPSALPPAYPQVTASIHVGPQGSTSALLHAEGSVWVAASFVDGGGGIDDAMLFRLDDSTNEIVAEIPLEGAPGWVTGGGGLAYGFGSIWVAGYAGVDGASQAAVHRVDPASNRVIATILLGGTWGADVEVDEGGVWAAYFGEDHAAVARIDPATDSVVADVPLPSDYVRRITAAGDGVVATELEWSGNQGPCTVLTAIDPVSAEIVAREPGGADCGSVELIEWNGEMWAYGAGLRRVDPTTARIVGEPISFDPEQPPRSFLIAVGNEVWFGAYPGGDGVRPDRLARMDGTTGTIEYFIETGGIDAVFAPETRTIWILEFEGAVTRVDLNGG
jgi:TolB protein